jgi:hypothetical protein
MSHPDIGGKRQFFRKGISAKAVVRPPKPEPVRPPDHKRKIVMAVRLRGTGTMEHKTMASRKAAQVLGAQKGGLKSSALGTAHRWTTETARKAAIKSWTKRRKFNRRIMARVGVKANRAKGLWREPLRAYYAENPTRGIWYDKESKTWSRLDVSRLISERAALTALGHLSTDRGFIPDSITPVHRKLTKKQLAALVQVQVQTSLTRSSED